jgi:tetratricopeptide (TPR) repeat protein
MEGKWAEAEADLRAALKMDPDQCAAAANLAVCLERLGRLEEARGAYGTCLKMLDRARGRRDSRIASEAEIAQESARIQQHLETLAKS